MVVDVNAFRGKVIFFHMVDQCVAECHPDRVERDIDRSDPGGSDIGEKSTPESKDGHVFRNPQMVATGCVDRDQGKRIVFAYHGIDIGVRAEELI